jgi:hypothetical protein
VKGAHGYELLVTTVNRRRELFRLPATRRLVTVARVLKHDRATVRIVALSALHRPGRATHAVARAR